MVDEADVELEKERDRQENIRAKRYMTWAVLAAAVGFPLALHFLPQAAGATGAFYQLVGQVIVALLGAM